MPPTIEQQLDLPVREPLGTETVTFPRLDLDDLINWASEVKQVRLRNAQKRLASNQQLLPIDRDRREQEVVDEDVQLGWLLNKSYAPDGIRKILVLSLKKAGRSDEDTLGILKRIHFMRQGVIARELLSAPAAPANKDAAKDGADSDFTSPETGDASEPSSTP